MGRDPSHPWVGESVPLDYANVISGAPFSDFGDAIRYRVRDDGSSTMVAGDSFIAGFYDSDVMLSGDDVVASFVVVCSGSGSLRLSGGTDPDWSLDDPGDATVPMGTHTVSGDTVVVGDPFPSFDVDAYLAQTEETIVYVECLSGTVTVNQVKLRLWPTAGVAGAWVDADGFDVDLPPQIRLVGIIGGGPDTGGLTSGSAASGWDAAATGLVDLTAPDAARLVEPASFIPLSAIGATLSDIVVVAEDTGSPGTFNSAGSVDISGSLVQQPDPLNTMRINTPQSVGTYGLDYSWPPDEVPGDLGVQVITAPTTEWGAATLTTDTLTPKVDGTGGQPNVVATVVPDETWADRSTLVLPLTGGTPIPADEGTGTLVMPTGRTVLVSLTHELLVEPPAYAGTAGAYQLGVDAGISATIAASTVTIPAYRYWSPTAVETTLHPLRLMQRGDGLGMGSGRALSTGTRQASTRLFGSL